MISKINKIDILGVKIFSAPKAQLLKEIKKRVKLLSKFYIVTPNPELVLASTKNPLLKRALNSADYAIPDGVGLKASYFSLKTIKGREFFLDLVDLAHKKNWKMFFLGGLDNEAELAAKKLGARFFKGPKLDNKAEPISEVDSELQIDAVKKINDYNPHFLFVAFGNPKQEIWIYKNFSKLHIGGAMAVGGTFRYMAGLSKLSPRWMEELGLEWLWRLFTEPFRFTRIWNAVIVFPLKVWIYKLILSLRGKLSQTRA